MVVVCPVCREVVHLVCGYIHRHGVKYHGKMDLCAASGTPYGPHAADCCTSE